MPSVHEFHIQSSSVLHPWRTVHSVMVSSIHTHENSGRNTYNAAFKFKAIEPPIKEGNGDTALKLDMLEEATAELTQCKKTTKAFGGHKATEEGYFSSFNAEEEN